MKCKSCPYFHIRQRPIKGFDLGLAECQKHHLVVDYQSMRKVNTLECVEDKNEDHTKL
mgnify:CR=1 FL=1